jgi:aldose 1-epimerase
MPEITLDNGTLRAVINSEMGAGMLAFSAKRDDSWLPLMPDARLTTVDLDVVNFLMIPYSNRIENGHFTFAGQAYQLENGENHAIHGDTRKRVWQVAEQSQEQLVCTFDSQRHADINWPWPFETRAEYTLSGSELTMRLALWNRGATAMPAGFGWHPYFSRSLLHPGEPIRLQFAVEGVYPDANSNRIPSGPPQPPRPVQDFSAERALDPNHFLDICCHGYGGNGHIAWPESGVQLEFDCSDACSHLVLYNPDKPYFAVEPVTNANNGVNLLAQGDPTSGVTVLEPGESLEATFTLRVEAIT